MTTRPTIWIQSYCSDRLSKQGVAASLADSAMGWEILQAGNLAGIGILVVDGCPPDLCDEIRNLSQDGSNRLLVLVPNNQALPRDTMWRILDAGASDILVWSDLPHPGSVIASRLERWAEVDAVAALPEVEGNLVGKSKAWKTALRQIIEVALYADKEPVLLTGETGTGKELAARLIHSLDKQRKNRQFVVVDCTNIVPELSGSELFGHERGAFTGAISARDGAFALADGGTLFLDEVGEMVTSLQIQLLRVMQEHTYKRVGSNSWRHTDFRLVCATNRDLSQEQTEGIFRRDLYYRIASWIIRLPPLRERADDIVELVRHFILQAYPGKEPPELDNRVREYLLSREYPGNVRDLKNLVTRIMSRHVAPGPVTMGDIPPDDRPISNSEVQTQFKGTLEQAITLGLASGACLEDLKIAFRDTSIRLAIEAEDGNLQRAAARLGVSDRMVQKWLAFQREKQSNNS